MIELNLNDIAARLEGLEETIIHKLIDRAQWCVNDVAYTPGLSGFTNGDSRSLFELRLQNQEEMDAKFGRFLVPEERPFNANLPAPMRAANIPDTGLYLRDLDKINLTNAILKSYTRLLPLICKNGDDGQYGSSVEHDVYAIQSIARRIHYGALYVAESKFRADPEIYTRLIKEKNVEAMMTKLTRQDVEDKIIHRIKDKVKRLQAKVNTSVRHTVSTDPIIIYYRDFLIPTTKQGQILYLLNRTL